MKKNLLIGSFLMFAIPELLWSPILNILSSFLSPNYIFRKTIFYNFSNNLISLVLAIQSFGLVGLTVLLFRSSQNCIGFKKVAVIICGIFTASFTIISFFVLWVSFSLRSIGW